MLSPWAEPWRRSTRLRSTLSAWTSSSVAPGGSSSAAPGGGEAARTGIQGQRNDGGPHLWVEPVAERQMRVEVVTAVQVARPPPPKMGEEPFALPHPRLSLPLEPPPLLAAPRSH